MSRCARGPVVFWLLTMLFTGASLCTCDVCAEDRNGNGIGLGGSADWKDWLLDEDARRASSEAESGPLVRRITPKSVFVAPSFSGCSEGYRQDGMGRCVKLVKVNQAAQLDFLLQKLNSKFAPANEKNKGEDDPGPFHVNIPLGFASYNATKSKPDVRNVSAETLVPHGHGNSKTETPASTDRVATETNGATPAVFTVTDADADGDPTPSPSTTFANEGDGRWPSENTVKRQPGGKPFVIVVANETGDHSFSGQDGDASNYDDGEQLNRGTEVGEDANVEQPSVPQTTTDFTTSNTVTTDVASGAEVGFLSEESDSGAASTTTETFGGEDSTPSSFVASTTDTQRPPTFAVVDGDPSTAAPLESTKSDGSEFFTAPSTEDADAPVATASVFVYTSDDNPDEPVAEIEKKKEAVDKVPTPFGEQDDEILGDYDLSSVPFGQRQVAGCKSVPPFREAEFGHGRIVASNPTGSRCRPADVPTTASYPPPWTTTPKPSAPYYVRFPADDFGSRPSVSVSYSSSSPFDDHKKNGFVRFPERISVSSPHRPLLHAANAWGDTDGTSSSSMSSGSWYPPPSSWFPLLQPHKHWPNRYNTRHHYESTDADRPSPVSSVFRKQYHDYRPPSSSHAATLSWIDKRMPWPHRH